MSLATLFLLAGCSLPRIIVLHDPLSSEDHIRLGNIYASQGKTEIARDQYRLAVEQDRKNGKAWSLLGDISCQLQGYREAEKAYEKALDLDPKNGDLHNNLAWVYAQEEKKLGKARKLLARALELAPDHRAYYLDTLGLVHLRLGETEAAIAAFRESVDTLPPDSAGPRAEAYRHLSEAYAAAGDPAQAEEARKRAEELAPGPP